MGKQGLATCDYEGCEGCAHPPGRDVRCTPINDPLMRLQHALAQRSQQRAATLDVAVLGVLCHLLLNALTAPVPRHAVDSHLAGDFACRMAAHAIGDDEELLVGIREKRVLVMVSNSSNVRRSSSNNGTHLPFLEGK